MHNFALSRISVFCIRTAAMWSLHVTNLFDWDRKVSSPQAKLSNRLTFVAQPFRNTSCKFILRNQGMNLDNSKCFVYINWRLGVWCAIGRRLMEMLWRNKKALWEREIKLLTLSKSLFASVSVLGSNPEKFTSGYISPCEVKLSPA